jgi:hypothetical protein
LVNRRLTSITQKGAEDLDSFKTSVINGLARKKDDKGNPIINPSTGQYEQTAWYDDYLDSDGSKTNRVIVGLGRILENKKFMKTNGNNPTWKSVQAYMNARQSISKTLMTRRYKTLNAKANADLKLVYDSIVNKLKNDDKMGFAYLYDRFLSQDLIYDKYLTPVAVEGNK